MIRDQDCTRADFIFYSNRIIRLLVEEGLNHLPVSPCPITTPVGRHYSGVAFEGKICGISIMRAGESMEQGLRDCCRSVRIGKILIQRDEETSKPRLFYQKLPSDVKDRVSLLLDPMLATGEYCLQFLAVRKGSLKGSRISSGLGANVRTTGGSALMAVEVLMKHGVPEDRILFLNLIASPEGIANFAQRFPKLRIITAFIDEGLDEHNYIVPGLGDFGDRYFGTA
jgi:uracil phosphoribosyltransferase